MSRIREEEENHSTPNLFDNLAIGIADRIMIDRRSMGLESFFNGKANFYWSVDFTVLRYLPCNPVYGGSTNVKFWGQAPFWRNLMASWKFGAQYLAP